MATERYLVGKIAYALRCENAARAAAIATASPVFIGPLVALVAGYVNIDPCIFETVWALGERGCDDRVGCSIVRDGMYCMILIAVNDYLSHTSLFGLEIRFYIHQSGNMRSEYVCSDEPANGAIGVVNALFNSSISIDTDLLIELKDMLRAAIMKRVVCRCPS